MARVLNLGWLGASLGDMRLLRVCIELHRGFFIHSRTQPEPPAGGGATRAEREALEPDV